MADLYIRGQRVLLCTGIGHSEIVTVISEYPDAADYIEVRDCEGLTIYCDMDNTKRLPRGQL